MGETSCGLGAYGDGLNKQDHVLAVYRRKYTRYDATLRYSVGLMDEREYDTSISRICAYWVMTVQKWQTLAFKATVER